jgi:hypothetical protein
VETDHSITNEITAGMVADVFHGAFRGQRFVCSTAARTKSRNNG